ncbi:EamA family transporter [Kineosporia succinea]|uniref:Drug/metabolite transporter (DMT)-like permease n=1 Tax=Kineosporia succinea TaxID=84632 RepID=A0ABT9PFI0_9ACTN|nr:DMT family transporter [Kineosporia succinea]MDP9831149.1 drug/metabolite transporter (DMT)-like permease [Kineosporia succinea]
MKPLSYGLLCALLAAAFFGTSGSLAKPLLDGGWSPVAAVTLRALVGAALLAPVALVTVRGRWRVLWQARSRVLLMGVAGVACTQLAYFAAIQTIPVSTALLIEFLAPLILVAYAWASTRRTPSAPVLLGSALAVGGLLLVIGPGALRPVDPLGLAFAFTAALGCAVYFAVAAQAGDGLPPVALAASGLLVGGVTLALVGASGLLTFTVEFGDLDMFGATTPWWVPLLLLAVIGTAVAYAAGITASAALGSRLASFAGLLEVAFAALFAWVLLGENLGLLQILGGALILGGIAAVRSERTDAPVTEPLTETLR